jgi:hypothetical protein
MLWCSSTKTQLPHKLIKIIFKHLIRMKPIIMDRQMKKIILKISYQKVLKKLEGLKSVLKLMGTD